MSGEVREYQRRIMSIVHSTVEAVDQVVDNVVIGEVTNWAQQVLDALKYKAMLTALVSRIFRGIKEVHPEAKWNIVRDGEDDGWEMNIYSNASSEAIRNITRPILASAGPRRFGLVILSMSLEQAEHEG